MISILERFFSGGTDEEDEKDEATLELEASREEKHQALESLRTKTRELRVATTTDPGINIAELRTAASEG